MTINLKKLPKIAQKIGYTHFTLKTNEKCFSKKNNKPRNRILNVSISYFIRNAAHMLQSKSHIIMFSFPQQEMRLRTYLYFAC